MISDMMFVAVCALEIYQCQIGNEKDKPNIQDIFLNSQ
jgi:hypothetical protein